MYQHNFTLVNKATLRQSLAILFVGKRYTQADDRKCNPPILQTKENTHLCICDIMKK